VTRRTIRGSSQDPNIRGLLISTVKDYPNSGVRMESLDALTLRASDHEVRGALLATMIEDPNPGVRLKALEALKPHHDYPDVRQGLVRILQQDDNPGMRVQAIELLTEKPDRELVGVLQTLVEGEPNNYVRLRMQRTLQDLNASVNRF
jgi:HEAT repeat protein